MAGSKSSGVTVTLVGLTDVGRVREHNEDVVVCDPERGLYAVIDGVGGELAGVRFDFEF